MIGLGCMGMAWAYETASRDPDHYASFLRAAYGRGIRHFDTDDIYGPEVNEVTVGAVLGELADDVTVMTKGGTRVVDPERFRFALDGSPGHLRAAAEASRERLQVETIDLYFLDRIDPAVPLERSWEALAGLVSDGIIASIGLSFVTADDLEVADRIHPVSAVQSELSLWQRGELDAIVPWCEEHDARFVAASPMNRGFLTGEGESAPSYGSNDYRSTLRWTPGEQADRNALRRGVQQLAAERGSSTAQVALGWVEAQSPAILSIPGTVVIDELDEWLGLAPLRPDEIARLDALPRAR